MKVRVCNVSRSFGQVKALNHVSFTLLPGHIYGLVGPNGAGKTTLLRIMSGLDQPDGGDVLYGDIPVTMYPERVRKFSAFMPDTLPNMSDMRVWEYLDFYGRSYGFRGHELRERLAHIEEFAGCQEFRERILSALSKGMKQRVSLARALLHEPEVLILDEPAAGLDPQARYELRQILKKLQGNDITVLLSSHILKELEEMCDGIIILRQGNVVAAGLMSELQDKLLEGQTVSSKVPDVLPAASSGTESAVKQWYEFVCLEEAGLLCEALRRQSRCLEVRQVGEHAACGLIAGGEGAVSDVLRGVLASGISVVKLGKCEMGLEEMFMKYTAPEKQVDA